MSLYAPSGAGMIHTDVDDLLKLLQFGDGMGWIGDPAMFIGVGVLERKNRFGKVVAIGRRYEIWRLCEDGQERLIYHCKLEEKDSILFHLTRMRLDAPGHVPVEQQIDDHNEKLQKDLDDQYIGHYIEGAEHLADVVAERTWGKKTFRQMPGLRDDTLIGPPAPQVVPDAGE